MGQDVCKAVRTAKKGEKKEANKQNILAQVRKKGRRREREKRKAQIENGDE